MAPAESLETAMNAKRRTPDRLERVERSVMGLMLMAAVAWAVVGGPAPSPGGASSFAASTSR